MFENVLAEVLSLEPGFVSVVLLTVCLVLTWFKRRRLAKFLPSISGDFLTRHLDTRSKRYPYGG